MLLRVTIFKLLVQNDSYYMVLQPPCPHMHVEPFQGAADQRRPGKTRLLGGKSKFLSCKTLRGRAQEVRRQTIAKIGKTDSCTSFNLGNCKPMYKM